MSVPFDFKKEYKEYYLPACKPAIVDVPTMNYIAVRGGARRPKRGGRRICAGIEHTLLNRLHDKDESLCRQEY